MHRRAPLFEVGLDRRIVAVVLMRRIAGPVSPWCQHFAHQQPVRRPQPPQVTPPLTARRLSAVGIEQELPLGDDAIELVTGADDEAPSAPEEATVDLTQTARDLRGGTTAKAGELGATGDADWMATQASDRPHRLPEEAPEPDAPPAPEDHAASTETPEAADYPAGLGSVASSRS